MSRKLFFNLLSLSLLCSLSVAMTGCDIKLPPMPWDPPKQETPGDEAEVPADDEGGGGGESEPIDMSKLLPEAMRNLPYEEVTIPMPDRLELYGRLYDPSLVKDEEGDTISPGESEEEYSGAKYPLVVLLHGLNKNHSVWGDLPATLVKAGYAVYVPDLRGHGKSTRITRSRRVNWRMLKAKEWELLPGDIYRAIQYFQKAQEDYPEIDAERVALVGEKLGANVATMTSKKPLAHVKTLVMLSPGLSLKGIDASRGLMGFTNPALILVGRDEQEAYTTAQHLYNWLTGPKAMYEYKTGQGTDILSGTNNADEEIRDWIIKKMPPNADAKANTASAPETGAEKHDAGHEAAKEHGAAHETPEAKAPDAKAHGTEAHH